MKKWMFLAALGGVVILFAADQPKTEPGVTTQLELAQLKSRVGALEARLAALESRVQNSEQMHLVQQPPAATTVNHDPLAPPHVAEGEVNGLKFYVVPLAGAK